MLSDAEWVSLPDAAKILEVSQMVIRGMIKTGRIARTQRADRAKSHIYIHRDEIEAIIAKRRASR